jgi:carbon starvation protein
MLQEALGHLYEPAGRTSWYPSIIATSALVCGCWGYFLWSGVKDPLGGINSLWPLFGIANQLLATVALCVATTILMKSGRARYAWVTLLPLIALVAVTFTASWQKIFHPNPRIGFLAHARVLTNEVASTPQRAAEIQRLIFNDRLDAFVCGGLIVLVGLILAESVVVWSRYLSGKRAPESSEVPFVATQFATD